MISYDLIIKKSKLMLIYYKKLLERFTADGIACYPPIFYKVQQEILFADVNSIEDLIELKNSIEELKEVNINDL